MAKVQGGVRLSKAARELNVGVGTIVEFLRKNGVEVEENPNTKIDEESYIRLQKEYGSETVKRPTGHSGKGGEHPDRLVAEALAGKTADRVAVKSAATAPAHSDTTPLEKSKPEVKIVGKIDLDTNAPKASRRKGASKAESTPSPSAPDGTSAAPQPSKNAPPPAIAADETAPTPPAATPPAPEIAPQAGETRSVDANAPERQGDPPSTQPEEMQPKPELKGPKILGKIDLADKTRERKRGERKAPLAPAPKPILPEVPSKASKATETAPREEATAPRTAPEVEKPAIFRSDVEKLQGPTVVGKIDLDTLNDRLRRKPEASATPGGGVQKRRRRKRIEGEDVQGESRPHSSPNESMQAAEKPRKKNKTNKKVEVRPEISKEEIEEKIKETRARISSKRSNTLAKGVKYRKEKRSMMEARRDEAMERDAQARRVLQLSEFVSVNELAGMMNIPVTEVIETCMNMGLMVSINMRLDAEQLTLVADEFNFKVEFVSVEIDKSVAGDEDKPEDLVPRPPVFTVLGHVDHGKTTLCDTIRKSNVTAREAGGITQHLGAYSLTLPNGRKMTLIDTPGHESFTAMRARGAKLTDVAIIVVSAEDGIMPQTIEAINHASVTGARIVFAINKIDSPKANPDKVKEELANHNYLIEEWGGKYQSQDISAKMNQNVDLLLEKVLLEADIMDLRANPHRRAEGAVIESMVDKGRGHCANVLIQAGTIRKGDSIVSGGFFGRVKALFDDGGNEVKEAGPSTPVMVVGLNGAPQAGDSLMVVESDKEARTIASKIGHIRRVQEMSSRKHITLDEIGRRIAIGSFQELNVIVKGDVDGSVEALSDSLIQLSTEEIQVNVIHRGVGQISESDVTLATTSNAVIVGFQVRPSVTARRLAEKEQIDIRLYSVIYDAIEEIQSAMEGMLSPEVKEEVTGTAEVLETFHISKVGTIAGCIVREGKISRGNKVRIVRDGIVIYTSELSTLKRFKDDVKEVNSGMDCGISIKHYNDIKVGDFIESFKETEVKRTL